MYNHNMFLVIGMILTAVALTDTNAPISYAEKRECKDLTKEIKYNSEGHDDNKEIRKSFQEISKARFTL